MIKRLFIASALLFALALPAAAASVGCLPTTSTFGGLTEQLNINAALADRINNSRGATPPNVDCSGAPVEGEFWENTGTSIPLLQIFDATNFLSIGGLDKTNHLWLPIEGGGLGSLTAGATTDLCSIPQDTISITGTTTITSFGSSCQTGQWKRLIFGSATPITYNASAIVTPTGKSITADNGTTAWAEYTGSAWRLMDITNAAVPRVYYGGIGGGTANAITLSATVPSGFALSPGVRITFLSSAANTGAVTLTPPGGSAIAIKKASSSGLVALAANDIPAGGVPVDVWYDGTQFDLLGIGGTSLSLGTGVSSALAQPLNGNGGMIGVSPSSNGDLGACWNGTAWIKIGSNTTGNVASLQEGSSGGCPFWGTSSGAGAFVQVTKSSANPSNTGNRAAGTLGAITPLRTGNVQITFAFSVGFSSGGLTSVAIYTGTGGAPSAGTAISSTNGTICGLAVAGPSYNGSMSLVCDINMTVGTAYWFDIAYNGSGTGFSLSGITGVANEY
ncbi:hypothetical protein CWB41_14070 [Methylovirgula ligni]|uniref:Ig-like domain-containing protein n=1 Tax=Methylovirgula ligni TaxID=569860 RepID=A0A3D9YWG3_9HYPH|nr:hypothetical protein [Methylovirgula ligni]QAY96720.1 hypothetical protein CWB41_14070 [Methylovirgula ligni]REF83239.1 hypothetical protein DES32_3155 [Methylovirgula ligni]